MLTNIGKIRTLENSSGEMCRLYTEAYRGNWNDLQVQHNFPWKTDDSEKMKMSIIEYEKKIPLDMGHVSVKEYLQNTVNQ